MPFRIPNSILSICVVPRKASPSMFTGIAIGTVIFLGSIVFGAIVFFLLV